MKTDTQPAIDGIHHLKFAVADPGRSLAFYEKTFGARRIPAADHRDADGAVYAYICEVPGLGTLLDLRLSREHAEAQRRFDPVTLNIADRAELRAWAAHLDALGVPHSGEIVTTLAFMLVIEDPDGRRIRLYTREKHGPELPGAKDHPWMRH
ncbi:MAG: VOC family protein [Sphingomonas sp.]